MHTTVLVRLLLLLQAYWSGSVDVPDCYLLTYLHVDLPNCTQSTQKKAEARGSRRESRRILRYCQYVIANTVAVGTRVTVLHNHKVLSNSINTT